MLRGRRCGGVAALHIPPPVAILNADTALVPCNRQSCSYPVTWPMQTERRACVWRAMELHLQGIAAESPITQLGQRRVLDAAGPDDCSPVDWQGAARSKEPTRVPNGPACGAQFGCRAPKTARSARLPSAGHRWRAPGLARVQADRGARYAPADGRVQDPTALQHLRQFHIVDAPPACQRPRLVGGDLSALRQARRV